MGIRYRPDMIVLALDGMQAEIDAASARLRGLYLCLDGRARAAPLLWPLPHYPRSGADSGARSDAAGFEILDRTPLSARFVRRGSASRARRYEIEPGALRIGLGQLGGSGEGDRGEGAPDRLTFDLCRCPFALGDQARLEAQDGRLVRLHWRAHGVTLTLSAESGRVELESDPSIDDPYMRVALVPGVDESGEAEAVLAVEGGPAALDAGAARSENGS